MIGLYVNAGRQNVLIGMVNRKVEKSRRKSNAIWGLDPKNKE